MSFHTHVRMLYYPDTGNSYGLRSRCCQAIAVQHFPIVAKAVDPQKENCAGINLVKFA